MHIGFRNALVALIVVALPAGAQQPAPGIQFDRQLRSAAALESHATRTPETRIQVRADRPREHAPVIGAVIGAVALPAATYLAFHDSDSGPFTGGAILLFGALGAVLGYMAGLIVRGHW